MTTEIKNTPTVESNENQATPEQARTINDVNSLKNAIDSRTTAEQLNNQINNAFLEELKGLNPDDANELKTKIQSIQGYDTPDTQLNKVYNYVVNICNAFKTEGNQEHNITNKIDVNKFLNENELEKFSERIDQVEYVNIVAKNEQLGNVLTAIKGIINGKEVSGNTLVKIADYLGINTKKDSRYENDRQLDKLGEKIFSLSNMDGLYIHLQTEYDKLTKNNEKIKNFIKDPFSQFSLNDLCKKLIGIKRDGKDLANNEDIQKFCKFRGNQNVNIFVNNFNEKNKNRIDSNINILNKYNIMSAFDDNYINTYFVNFSINDNANNASNSQKILEYTYGNTHKEFSLNTAYELFERLSVPKMYKSIIDTPSTNFVNENEFKNLIETNNDIQKGRYDQIFSKVEEMQKAAQAESEEQNSTQTETTPAFDTISEYDIKDTKMWGKGEKKVRPGDVAKAINAAIESVSRIQDEAQKKEITDRINTVISKLKEPGEKTETGGQLAIEELQKTMKEADPSLIIDGKFGPKTFNAVKKYVGGEITQQDKQSRNLSVDQFNKINDMDPVEVEVYSNNPKEYALTYLLKTDLKLPGKNKIIEFIKDEDEDGLRNLQLHLLPVYTGKIDGTFGTKTLSALEKYIQKYNNIDYPSIYSFASLNKENIINFNDRDLLDTFVSISDGKEYKTYFHNGAQFLCTRKIINEGGVREIQFEGKCIAANGEQYKIKGVNDRFECVDNKQFDPSLTKNMINMSKKFKESGLFDFYK